ncbi:predicted protein [Pyrenophora tritici-repentis Pt-1C-BFP]|uniref:Uncharacterized protein n=1 Tax=Pyrenophora tritici-repentis (strain Pt-1C-BFP) TaxID=426418 RepID=B2VYF8_PYRTR|nr:uncharacterized protein PTRG_02448 [Pyrenophora tritici-repentis Pt-1C-BFP]EDU44971.1 predicted protein [Pyrenophora tritici-repentis Pt-1C-BFP]PWO23212.1 hypothetical protein PtrARCrB10_08265 [Pyrenophora tritici-repentis]
MGVIADLFSCGRSRRTRELSTEPHLTNDATPQLHVPGLELEQIAHETTATGDKTTTDTANDIRVPTIAPVPSPVQQSVHHWDGGRSRSRDSNTLDFSVHHEKGKLSAGWMVEQKFLVTTTSSRNSTPAPEPEKEETASTLVRCPTPEEEPWNATVRAATPEPQVETSDASMLVRCATPEEEPWNATVRHATPEPEAVSIRCATPEPEVIQVSRTATPEPEPQQITLPVEEVAPVSVVEEVRSATPEPVVEIVEVADEVEDVQVTKKTAPASLLDLPPEVRNRIYESMNEDVPIRMCRHDDPALAPRDGETAPAPKRQFYGLTQACRQLRSEFLPIYAKKAHYIIDLWSQKANLVNIDALQGQVSMDIDAACFDMEPIDLLPLIRTLVRKNRTDCQFTSTEGVVFRSIAEIVLELNKLLPKTDGSTKSWLSAVNGPMKRIDLHLFPHDDIRQYYRFRGAEPLLRVVYPSAVAEDWMKRSSKSEGYEAYMQATGLDKFEMHVVVGHASRRTTNEGRLPLDWRMSYQVSRMSRDCSPRRSMDVAAARMSIDRAPRMSSSLAR